MAPSYEFFPLVVLSGLWSGLVVSSLGLDNINRSEVMFILLIHLCAHASSSERWTVSEGEEDKAPEESRFSPSQCEVETSVFLQGGGCDQRGGEGQAGGDGSNPTLKTCLSACIDPLTLCSSRGEAT
ncbi:unnamed protein product [Leuciscus chuanchicus]